MPPSWFDDAEDNYTYRPGSGTAPSDAPTVAQMSAPTAHAPDAGPAGSALASRYPQIVQAYQQYLGRTPSDAEIASQTGNGSFRPNDPRLQLSVQNIIGSQEAQTYKAGRQAQQPAGNTTNTGGAFDMNAFRQYYTELISAPGRKGTMEEWNSVIVPALKARFPQIQVFGSKGDKIKFPDGRTMDAVKSAGLGGQGYNAFSFEGEGGGGGAAQGGYGSLLEPWNRPDFTMAAFEPPPAFKAPTLEDATNSAGFQFRLGEGLKALQRSAAAKGTLLTGGTMKDLVGFGQNLASDEYDKVYGRALAEDQQKYNRSASEYDRLYANRFGEYGNAYNIFNTEKTRPFNMLSQVMGVGANAAGNYMNAASNYANSYGNTVQGGAGQQADYLTQGANANAAGQIGRANAWNNAVGQGINTGVSLYAMSRPRPGAR